MDKTITWNSKGFQEIFQGLKERQRQGFRDAHDDIRKLRAKVFLNTVALVRQGYYILPDGEEVLFPNDTDMIRGTVFYEKEFHTDSPTFAHTEIEVVNEDCLQTGVRLLQEGFNPAILNMASRRNPGGGVMTGSAAQEESLFRRTNLFRSLYQFATYAEDFGLARSKHQYPLDRNYGGIYTPEALLFREGEGTGYALMQAPVKLSFIAVAGMNRPELTADGQRIVDWLVEPVKNKIRTILRIGMAHHHDALVLGALGCGAFRNPPRHVARLFNEVFDEREFQNKFRKLVFAILDDHNAHRSHNPEGNYQPFVAEFGQITHK